MHRCISRAGCKCVVIHHQLLVAMTEGVTRF